MTPSADTPRTLAGAASSARWGAAIVAVEVVLVLVLVLDGAADRSLWVDEVRSLDLARDWDAMWRELTSREANMWLYYVALHAWIAMAGESELAVRALSGLFAAASIPLVYVVAARLFDREVGVLAGLVLALNAFLLRYGQEARGYAMLAFFVLAATWAFVRFVEAPRLRTAAAWATLSVLAFYVHFFAVLVTGAQLVSLAAAPNVRRLARPAVGAAIVAIALAAPAALFQPLKSGQVDWITPVSLLDVARVVLALAGGTPAVLLTVVVLGVVGAVAGVRRLRDDRRSAFALSLVAAWVVVPIAAPLVASLVLKPLLVARYAIIALPAMAIAVALGIASLRDRRVKLAALFVLVGASAHAIARLPVEDEDWRAVARTIATSARASDGVVVFAYHLRGPLEHYLARALPLEGRPTIVDVASGPYSPGGGTALPDPDVDAIAALPARFERVWLVLGHDHLEHLGRARQSALVRDTLAKGYTLTRREPLGVLRVLLFERALDAGGVVEDPRR